jgi:chaperonin cofactor prefoldin
MRNPYQVLREKERELEKVKHEVEALRLVGPLLTEEATASVKPAKAELDRRKEATTGQIVPDQRWP